MTKTPQTVYLKDYTPLSYTIDSIDLDFDLFETQTIVRSNIKGHINADAKPGTPFLLNGEGLTLQSISLDNKPLPKEYYEISDNGLTLLNLPEKFSLQIITEIHPEKNTELSGLYRSKTMFCTQCEAHGFRRITYFPDRPDIMTKFTTTVHADKKKYPVLLSNGNPVANGDEGERHFVSWEDPFKKPCYLFALVAGNLIGIEDHYVTQSGRLVTLKLYVEWENQDKCQQALSALKKAMKWDEERYGREYDLDIYMIVAVNDFNMGAMENKGLNLFNSKYVLASPESATDTDYQYIDIVVGHEYFHNWSGNRVTCRDWFQLSLKEGLTVFREKHFSSELQQSVVSLIHDAANLRARQFAEDSGPMSHPVRPESYVEINNFYTATVYEKGAEVIRMLKTLLGWETFRRGMDLYFKRHDGQAVTTDDFVKVMEEVSGLNLTQFKLWYSQAGTPEIEAIEEYNADEKLYHLRLRQHCPPTAMQPQKLPQHIPVAVGLLDKSGKDVLPEKTRVLSLTENEQSFQFDNIAEKPVLSLLRGFSAPVKIKSSLEDQTLAFLLAKDSDHFNRWDAGQKLTERLMIKLIQDFKENKPLKASDVWLNAFSEIVKDNTLPKDLKTALLSFPSISYLVELTNPADTDAIYAVKKYLAETLSKTFRQDFLAGYHDSKIKGVYQFNYEDARLRSYKNLCLSYLLEAPDQETINLAMKQWQTANNMTDSFAVLSVLSHIDCKEREQVLNEFYERWQHNPLVLNKWFRVQATSLLGNTLEVVQRLTEHPAFEITNPNKVYSLIGGFSSGNPVRFHEKSGKGYQFLSDIVLKLDKINMQVAASMMEALTHWRKFEAQRQTKMRESLEKIKGTANLSRQVYELVVKSLGDYSEQRA